MSKTPDEVEIPFIISVDDHIQEPPNVWVDRLPRKYTDIGPRVLRERVEFTGTDGGSTTMWGDVWYYEDQRHELLNQGNAADTPPGDVDAQPIIFDEVRPGSFRAEDRLKDMDLDHVEKSLCFPNTWVRFGGQRFLDGEDRELALLCVRAYNDFLAEDWVGKSNGRLFGVGIVPLWDPELAAAEVRRNAEKEGMRAVAFSELPTRLGLPSLYSGSWDVFIEACNDTGTLICIHVGSSSASLSSSDDAPGGIRTLHHYCQSSLSLSDWLLSGALARNPNIRLMYSEAQAGWMPFLIGRLDRKWVEGYKFYDVRKNLPELPSTYFRNQVFACVTEDPAAVMFVDSFGVDNFCFETDYPHPDGSFPRSVEAARRQFGHLSTESIYKIVRGNGDRLLTDR
jgi:predicted TIM-barrel fold metal-dependent hydrolase